MATPQNNGSDAFRWLDKNVAEALDTPDEAFDWIFMLKDDDWPLLEAVWKHRPREWREALAYVLYDGPVKPSQGLLSLALFDDHLDVAGEAASTLCHHREIEKDLPAFPPNVVERIQYVLSRATGGDA